MIAKMYSKLRSQISIIRLTRLVIAALATLGFTIIANGVLAQKTYRKIGFKAPSL
jgi:hypothetical protein